MSVVSSGTADTHLPTSIDRLSTLPPEILLIIYAYRHFDFSFYKGKAERIGLNRALIYFERVALYRHLAPRSEGSILRLAKVFKAVPEALEMVHHFQWRICGRQSITPLDSRDAKWRKLFAALVFMFTGMTNLTVVTSDVPYTVDALLSAPPPRITTLDISVYDDLLPAIRLGFPRLLDLKLSTAPSPRSAPPALVQLPPIAVTLPPLPILHIRCEHGPSPSLLAFIRSTPAHSVHLWIDQNGYNYAEGLEEILDAIDPFVKNLTFFNCYLPSPHQLLRFSLLSRFTALQSLGISHPALSPNDTFFVDLLRSALPLTSLTLQDVSFNALNLLAALGLPHRLQHLSITFNVEDAKRLANALDAVVDYAELQNITPPVVDNQETLTAIKNIIDRARGRGIFVTENLSATTEFAVDWFSAMEYLVVEGGEEEVSDGFDEDEFLADFLSQ